MGFRHHGKTRKFVLKLTQPGVMSYILLRGREKRLQCLPTESSSTFTQKLPFFMDYLQVENDVVV